MSNRTACFCKSRFLRVLIVSSLFLASGLADIPAPPRQGQRIHMRIVKDSVGAGGPHQSFYGI
jgi:hypothetical protein